MAPRVTPASIDADNFAGRAAVRSALARCSDWRTGARRFHVGTGHPEPTHDAGYTTAGVPTVPKLSISLLLCGGSPYTGLGANLQLEVRAKGYIVCDILATAIAHDNLPKGRAA
jgi:hypothetical protein